MRSHCRDQRERDRAPRVDDLAVAESQRGAAGLSVQQITAPIRGDVRFAMMMFVSVSLDHDPSFDDEVRSSDTRVVDLYPQIEPQG